MGGAKPANALQEKGRQIFLSMPCANCHNIVGEAAYGTLGPDLTHIASRRTLAAGTLMNTPGNLGGWISNSQAIKPGNQMPPNVMSSDELQALLAYLENLK
jgi:cytochrome c oxidase subunit 2